MSDELPAGARTGAQSVDRALMILSLFIGADASGLSLTQVAQRMDLRPSTAHRLLRALVRAGYLHQDAVSERYRLGPTSAILGRSAESALGLDLGQPIVDELARQSGETASVGVRDGNDVAIILAAESDQPLRFEREPGNRVPIHASALGKALLAFDGRDPEIVLRELGELPGFTEHTVSESSVLVAELRLVRQRGVALNREERYVGVAAVASPIRDEHGFARAAVGVQVPSARLDHQRATELSGLVVEAAGQLAETLSLTRL